MRHASGSGRSLNEDLVPESLTIAAGRGGLSERGGYVRGATCDMRAGAVGADRRGALGPIGTRGLRARCDMRHASGSGPKKYPRRLPGVLG